MRISDIFVNNQIKNQGQNTVSGQEAAPLSQRDGKDSEAQLGRFTPGQMIRGELVEGGDGEVRLKLPGDTLLSAKLDQNIALEIGKTMNFQVRSNGQTLTLTPLQTNLALDGPVTKALEMANLPVNSATAELTRLLMQAGLPIDRNSMQQIYREMIHQPKGEVSDLVDLHRLGLPVTEENLNQMSSYKNLTHQLVAGLEQTSAELFNTISQMQEQGKTQEAAVLFQEVLRVMGEEGEEAAPPPGEALGKSEEGMENADTMPVTDSGKASGGLILDSGLAEGTEKADPSANSENVAKGLAEGGRPAMAALFEEMTLTAEEDIPAKGEYGQALQQLLSSEGYSDREKMDFINGLLKSGETTHNTELMKAVLDSPLAKKLLADQFIKQWTITPEQVQDQKEVEKLYGRLQRQLKGITNALESAGQTQTNAFQSASNMNQNLDFLNQLNHMYAYVQLPLKLQQGEAHGDLYVYSNKKNLAREDGPITALLHLDMENLGPLDVYVTLQDQKVGTKFTVRDDEMLDFLEAHMDLLTARLEKRGYKIDVQTSVKNKEQTEENSGIAPILAKEPPGLLIQTRGFDVRT